MAAPMVCSLSRRSSAVTFFAWLSPSGRDRCRDTHGFSCFRAFASPRVSIPIVGSLDSGRAVAPEASQIHLISLAYLFIFNSSTHLIKLAAVTVATLAARHLVAHIGKHLFISYHRQSRLYGITLQLFTPICLFIPIDIGSIIGQ